MQTRRGTLKKIIFAIILIIMIIFAFANFIYRNNERIISQNTEYITEASKQKAQRINFLLRDAQNNINILAHLYGQTITEDEEVNMEDLRHMADSSPFAFIQFADKNGRDVDELGKVNDVSKKDYFIRGMRGESGISAMTNSILTDGKLVLFYAPLEVNHEIIGVLMGLYQEKQLEELLYSAYFNEPNRSYLCTRDGTVIAGSSDTENVENIITHFTSDNYLRAKDNNGLIRAINEGAPFNFRYDGRSGPGIAYVTGIEDSDFVLCQVFPSNVTKRMSTAANSRGAILAAQLIVALVLYIIVLLMMDSRNKKRLILENKEMSYVIAGTTNLFDRFIFVDFENNTYKYLVGTCPRNAAIPPEGNYPQLLSHLLSAMADPEEQADMSKELRADHIQQKLGESLTNLSYEYCIERNQRQWEGLSIICLKRKGGVATQLLYTRQNVTASKIEELETNTALRESFQAAKAANQAKSDFLSHMSHDIRTPMNAIMGMTDIAAMNVEDPAKIKDCLDKIAISSRHLLGLINEILDMSKIESGKMVLSEEEFSLTDATENLLSIMLPEIEKKKQNLSIDINNITHHYVIGDLQRIQQIFVNIMSNSVKYTPEGGNISLTVNEKTSRAINKSLYEFVFTDDGIGMDSKFLETLFDPFTRAEDFYGRQTEGTGLGMTITKNIVNMMNGDIQVKSAPGKGSEFTVSLFLEYCNKDSAEEDLASKNTETDTEHEATERDYTGKKILLVEDNELNTEIAVEILQMFGFTVETAVDGLEAVKCVTASEENYYDLILMDIQMPNMNGYDATRAIRALDREDSKTMPIIAMSANAFADDIRKSKKSGMNAHIAKPIEIPKLMECIGQWVK